jgi:acyl-coenzyme A thioesterase PaaI-like protein
LQVSAHGGAVESLLDEATAEAAKMAWAPTLATLDATFRIKKAVPLNTTLRIACRIKRTQSVRCWVDGKLTSADGSVLYASCEAQLVDLAQLWAG